MFVGLTRYLLHNESFLYEIAGQARNDLCPKGAPSERTKYIIL